MRRQDPSQIPGRHDPAGDWPEVGPTTPDLLSPPRALGRPLRAVWELSKHTPAEDLTRRWAVGPANYTKIPRPDALRAHQPETPRKQSDTSVAALGRAPLQGPPTHPV